VVWGAVAGIVVSAAEPGKAMQLHIPTLSIIAVFITEILGLLLLFAWRREQETSALLWWGTGYLLGGFGFALLSARGVIPNVISMEIANALMLVTYSCLLAGTRAFGGRDTPIAAFVLAPLLWLTLMRVPAFATDLTLRIATMSMLQATFTFMMAYELWRDRAESLLSRWPGIIVLLAHSVVLTVRIVMVGTVPSLTAGNFISSPQFATMVFGTVLFTITMAFLMLSLTKERGELRHKRASQVDPLTGLANRRAFLDNGEALVRNRARGLAAPATPFAVILADLDRFKMINDAFGHAVGDEVLQIFARTLRDTIDADDLVGRLGGEEFAIILRAADRDRALLVSERIRFAFADAAADVAGNPVGATVSIGIAARGAESLSELLASADRALYRAKADGRTLARRAGAVDHPCALA
jgi:diguanylate cyclase (GGDEF)-like protein